MGAASWVLSYSRTMTVSFVGVAPVLPVRDVARALDRYRRLGFETRPYLQPGFSTAENPSYGYVRWGPVEIHLSGFDALDPQTTTSVCYLFVDDADALHAAWAAASIEGRLRAPSDMAHGKREFSYLDPDGNLLRVGSPLKQREGRSADSASRTDGSLSGTAGD